MTIVQINSVYARISTGRNAREMHEYLQCHGIDSYIATPKPYGLKDHCYKIGNVIDRKVHAILSRLTGKQAYFSHFATLGLIRFLERVKPDVVICHDFHANYINMPMIFKYLADKNIGTILVLHDIWYFGGGCSHYISSKCDKWKHNCGHCPVNKSDIASYFFDRTASVLKEKEALYKRFKKLAVVGVSKWTADDARQSILKDAYRITTIYNWIDLNTFCPKDTQELRKKYELPLDKRIILGVATTWSDGKGINVFHGLADILDSNYQIVLIGNSDNVPDKRDNIIYIPTLINLNELSDMYALADVFVNPSIQETFGKTTAESLCSGTPVVAYNSTATPELVGTDGICGSLIDTRDSQSFAKEIQTICDKGKERYVEPCRERAETLFCMEKNLGQYLSLFHDLMNIKSYDNETDKH